MDTNTETKRARLLDLASGGDGHVGPWIEKMTIRRPDMDDTAGYCLHIPQHGGGNDTTIVAHDYSLDMLQKLILIIERGATPSDPDMTDDEVEAERRADAARIAAMPPPEDHGKIVTLDE